MGFLLKTKTCLMQQWCHKETWDDLRQCFLWSDFNHGGWDNPQQHKKYGFMYLQLAINLRRIQSVSLMTFSDMIFRYHSLKFYVNYWEFLVWVLLLKVAKYRKTAIIMVLNVFTVTIYAICISLLSYYYFSTWISTWLKWHFDAVLCPVSISLKIEIEVFFFSRFS